MEESSPPAPPRRWYQFSLREILIATVAICALVALFARNAPYAPTDFFERLDEPGMLTDLDQEHRWGLDVQGQSSGSSRGPFQSERSLDWSLNSPTYDTICQQVMPRLYDKIKQLLRDEGCEITGFSHVGVPRLTVRPGESSFETLNEFSFTYKSGRVRGILRAWAVPDADNQTRLLILTDEW